MSTDAAPRKVLILFTEIFANGGIQRFNKTFISACSHLDVRGTAYSLVDTSTSIARHPPYDNIKIVGFAGNRFRFIIATMAALWGERYDWVLIGHVNLLTMTLLARTLRLFHRAPAVLIAHGIEVWSNIGSVRRFAMSGMHTILCVSRYTRQRILEQAPRLRAGRLRIFPNALAESWGAMAADTSAIPSPKRFILSVTRLEKGDRYKGIVTTIESLGMLSDESVKYMIVGHGNDLPFLQMVAARCGVLDRVVFLSGVSDTQLINLYRTCLAFVLPSGKEGFGIVFLEAMYFGAPVIAAREKGALDVVTDHETGLLVNFGDSIALKQAIEKLSFDSGLCDQLRSAGRSLVVDGGPFTFARFVDRCAAALGVANARISGGG
jgi:phosphatidyl-myo-inositol dimannoside synthase